ncbi:MAG TPA: polysaccharide biosynthesis C-terminal domain-containing protein [Thermoanaerobaculia bacterium]
MSGSRPGAADWWVPGGALFLARAGDALLRFGLFFATAKLLDPSAFSLYALVTAALATCQWLLALGAPRLTLYFHARGERGALFAWLYLLAAAGSGVVLLAVTMLPPLRARLFPALPDRLVLIGIAPLPFLLLGDSLGSALVAARRARAYGATLWMRNAGSALVLASALLVADRLSWVLWGRLAVSAAVALVLVFAVRATPDWRGVAGFAPAALRYGGPTALSSGAVALHRRADVLLLSAYGRTAEIGAYSLAQAIAETFWLATDSLENALFVDVARQEPARARSEARRAFGAYLWLGLAGLVVGIAGGELLIRAFFGRYPDARPVLPWLIAATVAWGVARPFYSYLSGQGRVRAALLCNAVGLAVNLLCCALWIPRQGALGAARACLASYGTQSVMFWAAFRRAKPGGTPSQESVQEIA